MSDRDPSQPMIHHTDALLGAPAQQRAPRRTRVLVADGDALARRAVVDGLRAAGSFVIVGQASRSVECVELTLHYRPDVLLLSATLPGTDPVAVAARVSARVPGCRVVMLATDDDLALEMSAIRAGAAGFLSKEADVAAIAQALERIVSGEHVISRALTSHLVDRLRRTPEAGVGTRPVKSSLTTREWEVLDHVCGGASTRDVAERLFLSSETVNSHIKSIMRKLGVHSRADAVVVAGKLRSGLLV